VIAVKLSLDLRIAAPDADGREQQPLLDGNVPQQSAAKCFVGELRAGRRPARVRRRKRCRSAGADAALTPEIEVAATATDLFPRLLAQIRSLLRESPERSTIPATHGNRARAVGAVRTVSSWCCRLSARRIPDSI